MSAEKERCNGISIEPIAERADECSLEDETYTVSKTSRNSRACEKSLLAAILITTAVAVFVVLTFVAWRRYLWAAEQVPLAKADTSPYSLTDVFGDRSPR